LWKGMWKAYLGDSMWHAKCLTSDENRAKGNAAGAKAEAGVYQKYGVQEW